MKLKYYLRGMGIGIILTAIVMGFALGGRRGTLSDAEVIKRAKELGMVENSGGTLSASLKEEIITDENDAPSSGEALDKEGKEISKEEQQTVSSPDKPVSEVAQKEEEGEEKDSESNEASTETSKAMEEQKTDVVETAVPKDNTAQVQEETDVVSAGDQNGETEPAVEIQKTPSVEETQPEVAEAPADEPAEAPAEEPADEPADEALQEASVEEPRVQGKTVVIPGGSDSDRVAEILYNEGFVDNSVTFNKYLIDTGMDRRIRSGNKVIPEGATYEQIAAIITSG